MSKKDGYITSHRQVYVPWNDIAIAETMRMLPFDSAGTEVGFDGNSATVVTHKSTSVSDDFGSRSATMVFTGDNHAYEVDAGGNVIRELTSITTRATEFATPESMPAKLPPNSAYTYCVEMSVDGVERVKFDKPVVSWVDNFLGFDVGEAVPVGYYDRDRGVWVPSDNGVVVQLLDTDSDGVVDALDATGDGAPDDLDGDSSFIDEVQGLNNSSQYVPGNTYWRFSVTHFTPYDCNYPFGPPDDGTVSNAQADPDADQQKRKEKDCKTKTNSFMEDRSRIYHEDIAISGTDMTLHYASNRVAGYKTTITVPASGATVPASLKYILVKAEIAGRTYESLLSPLPYQTAEFTWDELDHLGRLVIGPTVAHVDIGFVYDGVYYSAGDLQQAFAKFGSEISSGIRARQEVILWKRFNVFIDGGNHVWAQGKGPLVGGWSISNHHYFSPKVPSVLFKGDGMRLETNAAMIEAVVGIGVSGDSGDGGPASEARISDVRGLIVDAGGNLYFCDNSNHKVRKVDSDGIITTVAGNGTKGYSGDGGPAAEARLNYPETIALDGSGNLYIADTYNNRVRKVDVNGIITTVAGNGTEGYSGDGSLATEAMLFRPMGVAVDVSGNMYIADMFNRRVRMVDATGIITTLAGTGVMGDSVDGGPAVEAQLNYPRRVSVDTVGNLYFTDGGNNKVYKVDSSGTIATVAGTGLEDYAGDGGLATEANLNFPVDVAVDAMRNLYITDTYHCRIRKVDVNGIITTVAGSGIWGYSGDGSLATEANLHNMHGVAVDASGHLYIGDGQNYLIRKVAPPSVFQAVESSEGDISFADEENGLAHIMSSTGLHKKTIDLDTGVTLRTFGYDAEERLITITDQFGNITTINRDTDGVPTSIVSPDGLTTQLAIDADRHLNSVNYPDGSGYAFEYTTDGLMTAEVDPNGNRFEHVFNVAGRVTDILDPEGGHWNFSRSVLANGEVVVQKTTGEGDVTTSRNHSFSGVETGTITGPSGGVSSFTDQADGLTETMSLSCGTELTLKYDLDPEYKFKYVKERTSSTPAGLSHVTLRDKTYQDTDADEVSDLITETVTVNDKAATLTTNTLLAKRTATSPTGRTVSSFYDPATLTTTRLTIPGLDDVTYGYDPKGRLTSVNQGSRQSSFTYDAQGFLVSVTDPESRTVTYDRDALGRVTGIHRPDSSLVGFTYDDNGNMTVLTNPAAINHGFDYNGVDKQTAYQAPLSGRYQYLYDKDRRLTDILFPSGRQISNLYINGRLTQTQTPEGNIDYSYLCATKIGSVTMGTESLAYTYDASLVLSETSSGTLNQALQYTYNNDFQVAGFTYAGATESYSYDNDGLLTGAGSLTITRNADNGLPETVADSSYSLARSFNSYGEVAAENTTVSGQSQYAYSLTRNLAGQITARTETVAGANTGYAYTYDPAGRLLTVTKDGALVEEYQYDTVGRRTYAMSSLRGLSGTTLSYDDEDRLLTVGTTSYQYNLDGFLTTRTAGAEVTSYNYSSRGELFSATLPDGRAIEYIHDPLGRRIAKKVDGAIVEKYLWQGFTRLLAVYDGSDHLLMRFQYADSRMPVAMAKQGTTYYLGYDQVGSLRVVTDSSGNIVKQIDYDSFGSILTDSNSVFTVPFGFAGGLQDRDTGLVRFGYRDYDPGLGRWTAKDPLRFSGGDVDLFGYVFCDPVNWIDFFGLAPGDPYASQHEAAQAAINDVNPSSITSNSEYGGMIYRNQNGTYSYTSPQNGGEAAVDPGGPSSCPVGTTPQAYYHTHGGPDPRYDSENFSSGDRRYGNYYGVDGYVGTPSGDFKHYDHITGSDSSVGTVRTQ